MDGTQISPPTEFVSATLPFTKFLGVVLVAWHDSASCHKKHLVLQHVQICKNDPRTACGSCWRLATSPLPTVPVDLRRGQWPSFTRPV